LLNTSHPFDDVQLMSLVQSDRSDAFAALYDRHATAVYGLARRIVVSREAAEDVTQETFVGAWRCRQNFTGGRGEVRSWLLAIAHNRAIDSVRKRSRRDDPLDSGWDREAPERTDVEALRRAQAATIALAVGALPASQREIIELAYDRGLTQIEIATRLALPLGTVKSRARLALGKLRLELEDSRPAAAGAL